MRQIACIGLFFTLLTFTLYAREAGYPAPPDDNAILAAIIDPDSPYNYSVLMTRYQAGDTTLTLEEYRHLYYGYIWQPEYKPFETIKARDNILEILAQDKAPEYQDYMEIIRNGNEVMRRDPFSPSNINFLIYAFGQVKDESNELKNFYRLNMIKRTILSSGDGMKVNTAWHVTRFEHATDIMGSMNMKYRKPIVIDRETEYYTLESRGPDGEKGYYFNYGRVLRNSADRQQSRETSGWGINGMKIRSRTQ